MVAGAWVWPPCIRQEAEKDVCCTQIVFFQLFFILPRAPVHGMVSVVFRVCYPSPEVSGNIPVDIPRNVSSRWFQTLQMNDGLAVSCVFMHFSPPYPKMVSQRELSSSHELRLLKASKQIAKNHTHQSFRLALLYTWILFWPSLLVARSEPESALFSSTIVF